MKDMNLSQRQDLRLFVLNYNFHERLHRAKLAKSWLRKSKEQFRPAFIADAIVEDKRLLKDLYPGKDTITLMELASLLSKAYDLPFPEHIVAVNIWAGVQRLERYESDPKHLRVEFRLSV